MVSTVSYYAVSALFNGLFGLFVVYYVFLRNKQNPLNRSFLYFGVSVSGWSLLYAVWCWADNAADAERLVRFHMTFCSMIPATFFHFVSHFTERHERVKKQLIAIYAICAMTALLCHTNLMISGTKNILFFPFWPSPGPLTIYYFAFASAVVLYCFFLLIRRVFETAGDERRRAMWVLLAFTVGYGGGWINWLLWFDIPVPPLTHFFVGVTFAILAYAIVRHGLMDVDVLVELVRNNRLSKMGLLMSAINHEIKNPLYVMKGLADSYRAGIDQDGIAASKEEVIARSQALAEKISYQAGRASEIIQKFSGVIGRNGSAAQKRECRLNEVVREVFAFTGYRLEWAGISLDSNISHEADEVAIPKGDLEEILLNLIINGVESVIEKAKSAPKGYQPRISISSVRKGRECHISIEDNGMGISKENAKSLFYPFKTTKPDGTGLGLYITKRLCEKSGGAISVSPGSSEGARFLLILPAFPAFLGAEARPDVR